MQNALSNIDAAMDFVKRGDDEHPNRIDICEFSVKNPGQPFPVVGSASTAALGSSNSFGEGRTTAFPQPTSAFGQPSAMGSKPNPFGATPQINTPFGQPAPLGAFGQPSALGQKLSPFAATPTSGSLGQAGSGGVTGFSSFAAQPNPFGAPSQPAIANSFGQPSQAQANPFGQAKPVSGASPFGQTPATLNPFGGSSQTQPNPFAAPSQGQNNIIGGNTQSAQINPFAQAAPAAPSNPFGDTPTPIAPANPNPFGQQTSVAPAAASNPFGKPNISAPFSVTANPFGPVASAPANSNPFGLTNNTSPPSDNPFSKPQPIATSTTLNPFNATAPVMQNGPETIGGSESNPYPPGCGYQHPPLRSYASFDARGVLNMFKGKPVTWRKDEEGAPEAGFRNRDGTFQKICFPAGAPSYNKDTELGDDAYSDDIKAAYKHLRENRSFIGGVMPLVPPKREYCLWDF